MLCMISFIIHNLDLKYEIYLLFFFDNNIYIIIFTYFFIFNNI